MDDGDANQAQRRSWNEVAGPKWIAHETLQEASLQALGARLLAVAAVKAGEQVLEVGCGAGTLLGALATAAGGGGLVRGIDISATMLAVARGRAPAGVRLSEADAQTASLGGPYDVIVSRFGVMFFADPVAAFVNLRGALAPRGRIAFVCWAGLELNPHWALPLEIAARYLGPPAPRLAGAPGPLAFADPDRPRAVLHAAGFAAITLRTEHVPLMFDGADDAAEIAVRMGPAGAMISERHASAAVIAAIRAELARGWAPGDACVHVVTAERGAGLAVEARQSTRGPRWTG